MNNQPNRQFLVISALGKDRPGIVNQLTAPITDSGCNILDSRMTVLGGEFAILMQISLSTEQHAGLDAALDFLSARGYRFTVAATAEVPPTACPECLSYRIEVTGADHEGIVHDIAHQLSERGINIESMETETVQAPLSGTPLFAMTAVVAVPPALAGENWEAALEAEGDRLNLDIKVTPLQKQ